MKILFLHTDSFGGFGGIAKFNRDFLAATCSVPGAEVVALPRLVENEGFAEQLPDNLIFDRSGLGGKLRYALASLRAAMRQGHFDLVICGHINLLPVARLCQIAGRGKLGLIIHGIDAWQPTSSRMTNRIAPSVDFFIAVSDFTRQKFCSWTGLDTEKGFILPNCIDLEHFTPGPKNPDLLARYGLVGKKVILTVGRMSAAERYKGFDEILEVLPELAQEIPEIAYLVVGDGDDRVRLEHKARDLGLAGRVVFTGKIAEGEKVDHYRLADVFAMPGRGEGFGIVYLEALACGVPCVGSKVDGSRDALMQGVLGAIVDPAVPSELKDAISSALAQPKGVPERLGYFSSEAYRNRVHLLLGNWSAGR